MNSSIPKISVAVITYNQEKLIGRALDSILCQIEFVDEIIVLDDQSKDNTWDVIQDYKTLHPDIIKPFRNDTNLGIFGNIEQTWKKVTGDIFFLLAGDDTFCNGIFEKTIELIAENKIDFRNDAYLIFFDFLVKGTKGEERIFRNSLVSNHNSLSLKIRNLIYNRSMGMSLSVLKKQFSVDTEIGICAEGLIDIQPYLFSNKTYYKSFVGSVYYTDIGISTQLDKREQIISFIKYFDVLHKLLSDVGKLSKSDEKWISYLKSKYVFQLTPTFNNLLKYFTQLIFILELKYGYQYIKRECKTFLLVILRSL